MKIDVEDAEYEVLEGCKTFFQTHKIKNLIIEIDEGNLSKAKLFLICYGYKIRRIEYNNFLQQSKTFYLKILDLV